MRVSNLTLTEQLGSERVLRALPLLLARVRGSVEFLVFWLKMEKLLRAPGDGLPWALHSRVEVAGVLREVFAAMAALLRGHGACLSAATDGLALFLRRMPCEPHDPGPFAEVSVPFCPLFAS